MAQQAKPSSPRYFSKGATREERMMKRVFLSPAVAILLLFSRQIRMLIARVRRTVRDTRSGQPEPDSQDQVTSSSMTSQPGSEEETTSHQVTDTDPSLED